MGRGEGTRESQREWFMQKGESEEMRVEDVTSGGIPVELLEMAEDVMQEVEATRVKDVEQQVFFGAVWREGGGDQMSMKWRKCV